MLKLPRTDLHIREESEIILRAKNSMLLYRPYFKKEIFSCFNCLSWSEAKNTIVVLPTLFKIFSGSEEIEDLIL